MIFTSALSRIRLSITVYSAPSISRFNRSIEPCPSRGTTNRCCRNYRDAGSGIRDRQGRRICATEDANFADRRAGLSISRGRCDDHEFSSSKKLAAYFGFYFWGARTYNGGIQARREVQISFLQLRRLHVHRIEEWLYFNRSETYFLRPSRSMK